MEQDRFSARRAQMIEAGLWKDRILLDYFDALGPGDTTPPSRWPEESVEARATLYRQGLAADVITGMQSPPVATGVLSCTVTTPAADVTPAAKTVVTLGTLIVTP